MKHISTNLIDNGMNEIITCPYCNVKVVNSNFCSNCGRSLRTAERKIVDDALVDLVQGVTSLVQGTSKLVSVLGEVIEKKAAEGTISKEADKVLVSLGKAIKDVGEAVDRLSKEVAGKAEREIRRAR